MTSPRSAKERGIEAGQRALDRANRCDPEFTDTFMTLLRLYTRLMKREGVVFTAEDFRLWAYGRGLPMVGDARAIGPLIRKAVNDGIIQRWGFAPTVSSRGSVRATYTRA